MSKKKSTKKIESKSQYIKILNRETDRLTRKDIASWHSAWQRAIDYDEPKRQWLYDVYQQALIDNHLSGCIAQRKDRTLQKNFVLVKNDVADDKAKQYFMGGWFHQFLNFALDSIYWGHSLVELGNIVGEGEVMQFDSCLLIPRKHVIPEYGVVTHEPGDDVTSGVDYRNGAGADWVVEIGAPDDLGLLLKAAPQSISKKNMLAYWDTFGEMFGMPLRVATLATADKNEWARANEMMQNLGASGYAILPDGTGVQVVETSRGDAFEVYDKRIDRCNSEVSKLILGQTMTIDSGSSYSQSEVHLEILYNKCLGDAKFISSIINTRLIPLMILHGFPLEGYSFRWDDKTQYTTEEQYKIEQLLLANYEIDPQYFVNKYGIPITGKKAADNTTNLADGFFD